MRILPFPKQKAVQPEDSLLSTAEAVNFTLDPFGRVLNVDETWIELVGLTLSEFQAGMWVDRLHPEDASPAMRRFFKALAEGRLFNIATRFRIANGNYIHIKLRAVPFLDPRGHILHWRGVIAYNPAEVARVAIAKSGVS